MSKFSHLKKNTVLKRFKDSTGREYKVEYVYSVDGVFISSKQKNGKFKSLNANKGKGLRLLKRYMPEHSW
jgi:hypothetical protein